MGLRVEGPWQSPAHPPLRLEDIWIPVEGQGAAQEAGYHGGTVLGRQEVDTVLGGSQDMLLWGILELGAQHVHDLWHLGTGRPSHLCQGRLPGTCPYTRGFMTWTKQGGTLRKVCCEPCCWGLADTAPHWGDFGAWQTVGSKQLGPVLFPQMSLVLPSLSKDK